jgi:thiol-disulfide isomerase/thioredoxin
LKALLRLFLLVFLIGSLEISLLTQATNLQPAVYAKKPAIYINEKMKDKATLSIMPSKALNASDSSLNQSRKVIIYIFYGNGCIHCERELNFLNNLQNKYANLEVKAFEVWHNQSNFVLFEKMCEVYGIKLLGVPILFINDTALIGYESDETTGEKIEKYINICLANECIDPSEKLIISKTKINETFVTSRSYKQTSAISTTSFTTILKAPHLSFLLFTIAIGAIDGFNVCSLWIFCLLLSLLLYSANSRKRILLIGGAFIVFSGLVYFSFLEAWLKVNLMLGIREILRFTIGLAVLTIGLLGLKDFFTSFKGPSLRIPDSLKPHIYERITKLINEASTPFMLLGVAVLAFTINLFELLCTAGLPAAYTKLLSEQPLPSLAYHAYLFVYILFYMLDELILLGIFMLTLKPFKLSLRHSRLVRLIGGLIMISLGIIMLIKPEALAF